MRRRPLRLDGVARMYALVNKRARQEKFTPYPLTLTPPDYEIEPGKPRFIVRAVYGPVNGLPNSRIQTFRYQDRYLQRRGCELDSRDIVGVSRDDGAGVPGQAWGPRKFLWELFQEVALHGGDCTIFMIHTEQVMEVDPEAFAEWIRRGWQEPAKALIEPLKLLEG